MAWACVLAAFCLAACRGGGAVPPADAASRRSPSASAPAPPPPDLARVLAYAHRASVLSSFVGHLGRENPMEHEIARYLRRIEGLLGPRGAAGGQP